MPITDEKILKHNKEVFAKAFEAMRKMVKEKREELEKDPELVETETNKKMSRITIAIPRSFKNMDGEYETDFISCILWDAIAKNTVEYCKKGDIVGVKGRVQSSVVETDGEKKYYFDVIAERVTFLSSKSKEADE